MKNMFNANTKDIKSTTKIHKNKTKQTNKFLKTKIQYKLNVYLSYCHMIYIY